MSASHKMRRVRIIGGKHKGIFLSVDDELTKPTPDRVRETLFNWLTPNIEGANVLELFGGSGCLSVESISRGSNSAYYVDTSRKACGAIKDTLIRYRINSINVTCKDSILMVQKKNSDNPYDIIFIDPPYGKYELHQIVENLYEQSWADDESLIYLESNECLDKLVSPKYQLIRDSKAGNVYYGILKLTSQNSLK